jgi:hypothetical protein
MLPPECQKAAARSVDVGVALIARAECRAASYITAQLIDGNILNVFGGQRVSCRKSKCFTSGARP